MAGRRRGKARFECAVCIEDLRLEAKRYLPRALFDFVEGGAEDESTVRRNRAAFDEVEFVPRVLRDIRDVDTRTEILGCESSLPIALAPTGATGFVVRDGELKAARAAGAAGIPYTFSPAGTVTPDAVAAAASGSLWCQILGRGDKGRTREQIQRLRELGYRALVVTVDTPVMSWRLRDLRNHVSMPPAIDWRMARDGLRHPRWSWQFLQGEAAGLPNLEQPYAAGASIAPESFTWDDLEWITDAWGGPCVLKGIGSAADAREATNANVCGIVVSNHGGRQLAGARATIDALPEIVDAVGDRVEVLIDGGVRSGMDIVRALCHGAKACLIGRPFLYGLAAGGEAGVEYAVQLLAGELARTMALVGVTSVDELGRDYVHARRAHVGAATLER